MCKYFRKVFLLYALITVSSLFLLASNVSANDDAATVSAEVVVNDLQQGVVESLQPLIIGKTSDQSATLIISIVFANNRATDDVKSKSSDMPVIASRCNSCHSDDSKKFDPG